MLSNEPDTNRYGICGYSASSCYDRVYYMRSTHITVDHFFAGVISGSGSSCSDNNNSNKPCLNCKNYVIQMATSPFENGHFISIWINVFIFLFSFSLQTNQKKKWMLNHSDSSFSLCEFNFILSTGVFLSGIVKEQGKEEKTAQKLCCLCNLIKFLSKSENWRKRFFQTDVTALHCWKQQREYR